MTDTIISSAVTQPPAYATDLTKRLLAAHLNYEWRGDPQQGIDPKAQFQSFLQAAPNATFTLYERQTGTDGSSSLVKIEDAVEDNKPAGPNRIEPIMDWLEQHGRCDGQAIAPQGYWVTPNQPKTEVKVSELQAAHRFSGSTFFHPRK